MNSFQAAAKFLKMHKFKMKDIIQSFPVWIKELISPTLSIWVMPEWRLGDSAPHVGDGAN